MNYPGVDAKLELGGIYSDRAEATHELPRNDMQPGQ